MEEIVLKAISHRELSPQEKEQLDNWLLESQKNRMVFNQLKLVLKYPDERRMKELKAAGLARLNREVKFYDQVAADVEKRSSWISGIIKLAAMIIMILSVSLVIHRYQMDSEQTTIQPSVRLIEKTSLPGQKITMILSDGTKVKLNADSRIIVPDHFANDRRKVELIGEAFFEVNRDTSRPFIIKTNELEVEVLGTSFNVRSYDTDKNPMVAVQSGIVSVNTFSGNENVYLESNDMVSLSEKGELVKTRIVYKDLVFGWTEQRLVFEDTSLEEVFETVSRWYGVEIILKTEIKNQRPYTANLKNPTLEEVFKSLSHLYQFEYEKDEKKIIIR